MLHRMSATVADPEPSLWGGSGVVSLRRIRSRPSGGGSGVVPLGAAPALKCFDILKFNYFNFDQEKIFIIFFAEQVYEVSSGNSIFSSNFVN